MTKIAYLLVAHKNPEQVNMFIDQLLDYGDCDIYIHVDKKNPTLLKKIKKSEHVFICSVYDVRWGSFEIVKAAIELMRMARNSNNKYTHMYFGSGQDLLVKKGLYEFLENHPNKIFLHIVREIEHSDRGSACYRIRWPKRLMIRNDLHLYRFIRIIMQLLCKFGIVIFKNKKQLNKKVRFYEGRTWFIAPFDVLEYIVSYLNKNPDYIDFWEDSLASDLMFFQTLIMNSEFADSVVDELMLVKFGKTFATKNHPLNITKEMVTEIDSSDYYCARKFEIKEDIDSMEFFINRTRKRKV